MVGLYVFPGEHSVIFNTTAHYIQSLSYWKLRRHSLNLNWVNCLWNCVNLYNPGNNEVPLLATKKSVECSTLDIITVLNFRAIPCHKYFFTEVLFSYSPSFLVVVLQFAANWFNNRFYGSFHMYTVTMNCNRSGYLSYKAGSEQNVLMIFKFSGLSTFN